MLIVILVLLVVNLLISIAMGTVLVRLYDTMVESMDDKSIIPPPKGRRFGPEAGLVDVATTIPYDRVQEAAQIIHAYRQQQQQQQQQSG